MDKFTFYLRSDVELLLDDLPSILLGSDYKPNKESAVEFVKEIIGFINQLPNVPHYPIQPQFYRHFLRYDSPTHYAFFRRKSSPSTTWYIFFSIENTAFYVKHIGTNWSDGQYIR